MKCPECGDDAGDRGGNCENCGRSIHRPMSDHRECFTCHARVSRENKACPNCGTVFPRDEDADRVLASYEMGPVAAPFQKREFKVYEDRVVVETRSNITGVRVVGTVRRPMWEFVSVVNSLFFLVPGLALLVWGVIIPSLVLVLFGCLLASPGVYGLVGTLWLRREASSKDLEPGFDSRTE